MTDIEQFRASAIGLMAETEDVVVDCFPSRVPSEPAAVLQSLLLAECRGQHVGVRACVAERVTSPGFAITRGLLDNTVFLIYMSRRADSATELALRWTWFATKRQLELTRAAVKIHGPSGTDRLDDLESELDRLRSEADALGMGKLKKLPPTADMAQTFDSRTVTKHGVDILSQYVHSGADALARRVIPADGGDYQGAFTHLEYSEPNLVRCASIANAAFLDAALAVARLQAWDSLTRLSDHTDGAMAAFEALDRAASGGPDARRGDEAG